MEQWLPRGYAVSEGIRIKRMISASKGWQIYSTNQDSYVLVEKESIYEQWVLKYSLPEGIFFKVSSTDKYRIFCSSGDYLISSLDKGPFPENNGQIEAFSIAYNTTLKLYPKIDLHDAVYIEEFSLILPGSQEVDSAHNDYVYGKWLTGGVNISANSFERISQLMSWISPADLNKSFKLAGFHINDCIEADNESVKNHHPVNEKANTAEEIITTKTYSSEKFTLIGRPQLEKFFNENIIDIILNREQYKRMGISFPGAIILHGPPGCGKTYAVEKLSEYLGWERFYIDSSSIASSYIHDTSKKISSVFNSAINAAPSIIIIDEMEAFLSNRNFSNQSSTHHIEEVAEFLRKIPEAISNDVLVFGMTNMIDCIDSAILRRGRFDYVIEVKMASKDEIETLLNEKFKSLPIDEKVDTSLIASKLDKHPLSDVTFVLREAGRIAVKNGNESICQSCFEKALNMLPKNEEIQKIGFTQ